MCQRGKITHDYSDGATEEIGPPPEDTLKFISKPKSCLIWSVWFYTGSQMQSMTFSKAYDELWGAGNPTWEQEQCSAHYNSSVTQYCLRLHSCSLYSPAPLLEMMFLQSRSLWHRTTGEPSTDKSCWSHSSSSRRHRGLGTSVLNLQEAPKAERCAMN